MIDVATRRSSRNVFAATSAWLDGAETESRAAITRCLFALLIAARIAFTRFTPMARIPAVLFEPPWFLSWLSRPPSVAIIVGLQVVGVTVAILAACRRWPRVTFALAWLIYAVLAGLRASRGKIIHPDVLPLLASLPLCLLPGDARRDGERVESRFGVPLRTSMAVVAIAYFFTGYQKIVASGAGWITTDNLRWVLIDGIRAQGIHARSLAQWIIDHAIVAKLFAGCTLVVELGAPLVLRYKRLRVPFAIGAAALHLSIWLLLNLDYSLWIATVWIVMVDWAAVARTVGARQHATGRTV